MGDTQRIERDKGQDRALEVLAKKADQDNSHPMEIRIWIRSNSYENATLSLGEAKDFSDKLKTAIEFSEGSKEVYAGHVRLTDGLISQKER